MNRYFQPKDKPAIWTLKYCQDKKQLACSDEQPVSWDFRDKPDKMLDRNKRYSNSARAGVLDKNTSRGRKSLSEFNNFAKPNLTHKSKSFEAEHKILSFIPRDFWKSQSTSYQLQAAEHIVEKLF